MEERHATILRFRVQGSVWLRTAKEHASWRILGDFVGWGSGALGL